MKIQIYKWMEDQSLIAPVKGKAFLPNLTGRFYWSKKQAMNDRQTYRKMYQDDKFNTFKLKKLTIEINDLRIKA